MFMWLFQIAKVWRKIFNYGQRQLDCTRTSLLQGMVLASFNKIKCCLFKKKITIICFGCVYFHQYGLTMDHKALSALFNKTLKDNLPRIQRFRMRAMKYRITIAYVPGQDMWFKDTLSRSRYDEEHKPKPNESLSRDVEIHDRKTCQWVNQNGKKW